MSTELPYLFQQGKKRTWYFLRRVPGDVIGTPAHQTCFDEMKRIKKSLKTSVLAEALPEYQEIFADFERRLALARGKSVPTKPLPMINTPNNRRLTNGDLNVIKDRFFMMQIGEVESLLRRFKAGDNAAKVEMRDQSDHLGELGNAYKDFSNGDAHPLRRLQCQDYGSSETNEVVPLYWRHGKDADKRELAEEESIKFSFATEMEAERIMTEMGVAPGEKEKLQLHLNEAEHAVAEYFVELKNGNFSKIPDVEFLKKSDDNPARSKTLQEVRQEYTKDAINVSKGWLHKVTVAVDLYNQYQAPAKPISEISRSDIQRFINELAKYPANAQQRFPNKSFHQVLKENKARGIATLGYKTLKDGYLAPLTKLFNYAESLEYIENSPTTKVKVPKGKQHTPSKVGAFETEQLNRLFQQPIFSGCQSKTRRYSAGSNIYEDHLYWVPIVALYTGLRCAEIAKIELVNIHLKTAHPHLSTVITSDTSFKTNNAARDIPLLNALKNLGFFEYIIKAKGRGGKRLFDKWLPVGEHYNNAAFCKRFNDTMIPKVLGGIYDKDNKDYNPTATRPKSFHSLRKNFKTLLIHNKVNQAVADQILGHAKNQNDRIYGGNISVKGLYEAVKDLDYEGLELGHLLKL